MRATECGKEAWSVNCEPMNKNQIEGGADQGERANDREAFVTKGRWRKSGGCAMKECVLTWGDLALCLKGRRGNLEREVSRGHSSRGDLMKGRRNGRNSPWVIKMGAPQMFTRVKLATKPIRVKPEKVWQRVNPFRRTQISETRRVRGQP